MCPNEIAVPRWFIFLFQLIALIIFIAIMGHFVEDDRKAAIRDQCYLNQPYGVATDPEWIYNCIKEKMKEQ